jgi:hypothetical protein
MKKATESKVKSKAGSGSRKKAGGAICLWLTMMADQRNPIAESLPFPFFPFGPV